MAYIAIIARCACICICDSSDSVPSQVPALSEMVHGAIYPCTQHVNISSLNLCVFVLALISYLLVQLKSLTLHVTHHAEVRGDIVTVS